HFSKNEQGRDFVVGDIHGCFNLVEDKLDLVNFDPTVDRLFFVGDLVNRGEYSAEFTKWLKKPSVYSVRGNHEQMCLWFLEQKMTKESLASIGGSWLTDRIPEEYFHTIKEAMQELPLAMEIETKEGLIVIVHASISGDSWEEFKTNLINENSDSQI